MSDTIRIIITGGTFDKDYDPLKGTLTFRSTHLPQIIETVRLAVPVQLEITQLVDSLEMSEDQRNNVVQACARAPEGRVVVTHGTDTMIKTARQLGRAGLDKTIVLTGAMVPYAVAGSDAVFNLGCAFAAVQLLDHGVYVAMNGRLLPWDQVEKDRASGVFRRMDGPAAQ